MKRYDLETVGSACLTRETLVENEYGDWVLFDEAVEKIRKARFRVGAMKDRILELKRLVEAQRRAINVAIMEAEESRRRCNQLLAERRDHDPLRDPEPTEDEP